MDPRLQGKRILVTQANDFMGPAFCEMFRKHGAEVIEDRSDLTVAEAAAQLMENSGHVDVLVANLAAPGTAPYSAARSAQVGYVRSVGAEVARFNVQVNLIAQHFVENPAYFSEQFQQTDVFKELMAAVPAGRLATAEEDALLAVFLASDESNFFAGQAIPFSGGWTQ